MTDASTTLSASHGASEIKPVRNGLSGIVLCLLSMLSVQWGAALSGPVMHELGTSGTTWLRLSFAALFLMLLARPRLHRYSLRHWLSAAALGCAMAMMTLCFFASIQHIPLSLAVAIDFLGPLSVAALYGRGVWRILCPALAAAGILCLSWTGDAWAGNTTGVLLATGAAFGWGGYIILMKRVGQSFSGLEGLALSLMFAALAAVPLGAVEALGNLSPQLGIRVALLAIMVPLLPYALEYFALQRIKTFSFGILMSLEPVVGAAIGLFVLGQSLIPFQLLGVALVVGASILGNMRRP